MVELSGTYVPSAGPSPRTLNETAARLPVALVTGEPSCT